MAPRDERLERLTALKERAEQAKAVRIMERQAARQQEQLMQKMNEEGTEGETTTQEVQDPTELTMPEAGAAPEEITPEVEQELWEGEDEDQKNQVENDLNNFSD